MSYDVALSKAWSDLNEYKKGKNITVRFLSDEYTIDFKKRHVLSCNSPAKDYISILILHYFKQKLNGLPKITGEWISFKQLQGGEVYYPAFKKRVIDPILKKYGSDSEALLESMQRLKARRTKIADFSFQIHTFEGIPVLITVWLGDEEFAPQANVLFDKTIKNIFCTEDIVVLAGFVASNI